MYCVCICFVYVCNMCVYMLRIYALSAYLHRAYVYGHGTQRRLPAAAAAMAELVTTALAHLVAMESAAVVQVRTSTEGTL